ncbi:MAG: hypothetical protein ACOY93_02350 [Bacillota bacterium]
MAVRPVDSLTMVPRLNEAGRMIHHHEQQPYAFQHVLGSQMQEKAQREKSQVRAKEQVEQPGVQRDKEKEPGGTGPQARDRRRKAPEPPPKPTARRTDGRLDVKC